MTGGMGPLAGAALAGVRAGGFSDGVAVAGAASKGAGAGVGWTDGFAPLAGAPSAGAGAEAALTGRAGL